MERLALDLQQGLLMGRIEHLLMPVIATAWPRDLLRAIQDTNGRIGGNQSQRPADCLRWDGVIVKIEAIVDSFLRTDGKNQFWVERIRG